MNDEIIVSIICNTYNHEKYIEQAIQGFIKQQTEFNYEILIHDDASTDNTVKIIKKYEDRYPEIIKPIYQQKNQYSIDFNNILQIQFQRAKGKYIAFCEGDDFWIDIRKLSKQVHVLNHHPELDLCVHSAKLYQFNHEIGRIAPKSENCIITIEEMILGGGGYVATNSLMFRSSLLKSIPHFLKIHPIDYAFQMYASTRGGALYLNEDMSVYNYMNPGSWTEKGSKNSDFAIHEVTKCIEMLAAFDSYTNCKYSQLISNCIMHGEYEILWIRGEMKEIIRNKKIYGLLSSKEKFRVWFRAIFPELYEWLRKKKHHL